MVAVEPVGGDVLGVAQMVDFVCNGYLRLDEVVPPEVNDSVLRDLGDYSGDGFKFWDHSPAVRSMLELPRIAGALVSLLGPDPIYNHSFVHVVPPHHRAAQSWHADSVINVKAFAFDVLLLYFPDNTPLEMGPTRVLPGSHLRRVRFGTVSHYQHIKGEQWLSCRAGTAFIVHADLWHRAQPNSTDRPRYMFKIRLQAKGEQRGWFDTAGYADPAVLDRLFRSNQQWLGSEHREEQIQRAKLWRYVTGDDDVDAAHGQLVRMGIRRGPSPGVPPRQ